MAPSAGRIACRNPLGGDRRLFVAQSSNMAYCEPYKITHPHAWPFCQMDRLANRSETHCAIEEPHHKLQGARYL